MKVIESDGDDPQDVSDRPGEEVPEVNARGAGGQDQAGPGPRRQVDRYPVTGMVKSWETIGQIFHNWPKQM